MSEAGPILGLMDRVEEVEGSDHEKSSSRRSRKKVLAAESKSILESLVGAKEVPNDTSKVNLGGKDYTLGELLKEDVNQELIRDLKIGDKERKQLVERAEKIKKTLVKIKERLEEELPALVGVFDRKNVVELSSEVWDKVAFRSVDLGGAVRRLYEAVRDIPVTEEKTRAAEDRESLVKKGTGVVVDVGMQVDKWFNRGVLESVQWMKQKGKSDREIIRDFWKTLKSFPPLATSRGNSWIEWGKAEDLEQVQSREGVAVLGVLIGAEEVKVNNLVDQHYTNVQQQVKESGMAVSETGIKKLALRQMHRERLYPDGLVTRLETQELPGRLGIVKEVQKPVEIEKQQIVYAYENKLIVVPRESLINNPGKVVEELTEWVKRCEVDSEQVEKEYRDNKRSVADCLKVGGKVYGLSLDARWSSVLELHSAKHGEVNNFSDVLENTSAVVVLKGDLEAWGNLAVSVPKVYGLREGEGRKIEAIRSEVGHDKYNGRPHESMVGRVVAGAMKKWRSLDKSEGMIEFLKSESNEENKDGDSIMKRFWLKPNPEVTTLKNLPISWKEKVMGWGTKWEGLGMERDANGTVEVSGAKSFLACERWREKMSSGFVDDYTQKYAKEWLENGAGGLIRGLNKICELKTEETVEILTPYVANFLKAVKNELPRISPAFIQTMALGLVEFSYGRPAVSQMPIEPFQEGPSIDAELGVGMVRADKETTREFQEAIRILEKWKSGNASSEEVDSQILDFQKRLLGSAMNVRKGTLELMTGGGGVTGRIGATVGEYYHQLSKLAQIIPKVFLRSISVGEILKGSGVCSTLGFPLQGKAIHDTEQQELMSRELMDADVAKVEAGQKGFGSTREGQQSHWFSAGWTIDTTADKESLRWTDSMGRVLEKSFYPWVGVVRASHKAMVGLLTSPEHIQETAKILKEIESGDLQTLSKKQLEKYLEERFDEDLAVRQALEPVLDRKLGEVVEDYTKTVEMMTFLVGFRNMKDDGDAIPGWVGNQKFRLMDKQV